MHVPTCGPTLPGRSWVGEGSSARGAHAAGRARRAARRSGWLAAVAFGAGLAGGCAGMRPGGAATATATGPSTSSGVTAATGAQAGNPPVSRALDPSRGEVRLDGAAAGWDAFLVLDNGSTGIWTVEAVPFFRQYACPEVVGLDDRGRCWICVSYSGKWTPNPILEEKQWLGGLAHGDVDPRIEGAELYVGGKRGNLYEIVPYPDSAIDARRIAHLDGREIHTIVAGDLDPRSPGAELLVFTSPAAIYRVTPTGPDGTFETVRIEELEGRVRDAVVLPAGGGGPAADEAGEDSAAGIATVSRAGDVSLLRLGPRGPSWTRIDEAPMGAGRIALAPPRPGRGTVLYTTRDDGRIVRHEREADGRWSHETIFLGAQGARGVAAGRFAADPDVETVAVFGYDREVRLLTRAAAGWSATTIFTDRDKGHWLAAAELDGRNATDELLLSGYGGRIVMLARPPGYGRAQETAAP